MALVLKKLYIGYRYLFDELPDPRVKDYFLLSSPLEPFLIITSYIYFVTRLGPRLMQNRKPFELKNILIVYNLIQIFINGTLSVYGIFVVSKLNWRCALVDYSQNSEALLHLRLAYGFYLLKLFDILDTVFFVLRKSQRQVTFLHVYHHAGMVFATFVASKFFGGGEVIWTGWINVIVHSVMFTYYYLTAVDKKWKKSIGFKKFLTQIQIVQFLLNIVIYGRLLFNNCPYPKLVPFFYIPQNVFMVILFSDFYLKTYVFKKKQ